MNVEINFPVEIESQLRHTAAAAGVDVGSFRKTNRYRPIDRLTI